MELKTLKEVEERLANIDNDIDAADKMETLDALEAEKVSLVKRQKELKAIEERKATAKAIEVGEQIVTPFEKRIAVVKSDFKGMTPEEVRGTDEYRSGFYKHLLGRPMSDLEKRANEISASDAPGTIPTVAANRVFELLKQDAPLLGEVTLMQVPGNLTVTVESTNNDAALHTENASITPAADVMTSVTLGGFEIVKVNRISATVSAMSVSAFEQWLLANISRKLARKMAYYVIYGSGSSMPKGIDYSATWADGTNAVDFEAATPTADELMELVSYLGGGFMQGAKFLMNHTTLYGHIAPNQDNSAYKILSDDYKYLIGKEILLDDNCSTGDIFFGNMREGIIANLASPITVRSSAESGFLNNAIDFRGACLFDCDTTSEYAFVKGAATLTAGA